MFEQIEKVCQRALAHEISIQEAEDLVREILGEARHTHLGGFILGNIADDLYEYADDAEVA